MKESTKIKLFAIVAALTLCMFGCAFGQVISVNRFEDRPDITTLMPEHPVEFGYMAGSKENMIVTIVKDVALDSVSYKIVVCLPKGKNPKNYEFVLKFKDGVFYRYNLVKIHESENAAEYLVVSEGLSQLECGEVDVAMIRYNGDVYVGGFADKAYFQNFLQVCKN